MSDRPRFVLDTNVLVDAAAFRVSFGRKAFDLVQKQGQMVASVETLAELIDVLGRPRLQRFIAREASDRFLHQLQERLLIVRPVLRIQACRDPKDDKFLEVASEATAGTIITRDKDLLVLDPFRGIEIIEPETFVRRSGSP